MQAPQPPPNGGRGGDMARLGFVARWHCDRCGLGFEDYDACEAHEAGCDGTGGDAGAGAQDQGQQPEQGPPAPVVIPQDDDEDGGRPAAAAAAAAAVPQRAPHQPLGQPPAPAIIPIHNDGDNSAGGSVSAAGHRQAAAAPRLGAEAAVAQPAREAAQEAIDLTIDDSNSDGDGSSDDDNGDDDDEVVVVDDAGTGQSRRAHAQNVPAKQQAGAPPAVAAAAPPPPKRGVVTVWTCDVCGVAEFSTFEAAAAHEEACAAKKEREDAEAAAAAAATAAKRKAQQQTEAATATATVTVAAQNRVSSDQQHPSHQENQQQLPIALAMAALPPPLQPNRLLKQGAQPQPQAQKAQQQAKAPGSGISNGQQQQQLLQHASNSNINPVFRQQDMKYWSCDICNASFQSYEEACKHERNCEGNPNAPVKSITTFRGADGRPISDEASQLTEPVTLDDDQEPQPPAPPPAPYWTCDHCQVARFDTYEQAAAHERICRAVAKQLGRNDEDTAPTTNNSNTAAAPIPTPPTAHNLERKLIVADTGQQRTLPQDSSQKIQIPSGTVFPLMHEEFTKDKSLIVPPHVALALDQLVLAIKDADTGEGTPLAESSALIELDLCCRHCKEHFPVTSTNRLGFDVERVINGHFMGKAVCKSMPVDIPELMDKLQNTARMHGTDEGTKASIRSYSQYVVEQYSLVNLTDLKAERTIGMVSFKDNLLSSLELARSASEAAVRARMKALRDGLRSGKETSGGVKPRKRPSNSDVEDEESLGSSPADTTKMSAKRRKISKATSDGGDDSNTAKLVCMVDEDSDGHEYYVPPSGGVPLVSTQSASMFSQLSLYYQLVISNLELCHGINCEQGQKCALELRCHNCKSNPEFNTFITLSNVSCHNWHKAVKQLAKHVEDCPCLAQHKLQDVKSSRRNKKVKALAAYCEFLSSLYGMKNSSLGLVWEEVKPITYEYASKPKDASDKAKNIPPGQLPRHNLMLPPGSAPKRTIIPDFYFFLASQYHFTLMKRETSPSNKSTGLISAEPDLTLAICCRHCLRTRPLESIRDGCSSSRYLLESHYTSCPATGRVASSYLDDLRKSKATQEKQCPTSIITCMKNTMTKTYGMVDLEWNGTCSGVGFSTGLSNTIRRLSKKYNNDVASWESFRLPLLPQESVRPVTEGLRLQIK